jgi:hypothetical protein
LRRFSHEKIFPIITGTTIFKITSDRHTLDRSGRDIDLQRVSNHPAGTAYANPDKQASAADASIYYTITDIH